MASSARLPVPEVDAPRPCRVEEREKACIMVGCELVGRGRLLLGAKRRTPIAGSPTYSWEYRPSFPLPDVGAHSLFAFL
jgi:hypothetical protein